MAERQVHPMAQRLVLYRAPGMDEVTVRRDLPFRGGDGAELALDLYLPSGGAPRPPAVVIVGGYPGGGVERILGCPVKDLGSSVSWGRLLAASGVAAVTYLNRHPVADLEALLLHLRESSESLGIDATRLGLWAASGNASLALWALTQPGADFRCAALCYGYLLDLDGSTAVAEAAAQWGFVNPAAGLGIADLPPRTALFLARAGRDETPGLTATLDRFVARALERNLALTLVNHPEGPHAFDLLDDGATSRQVVRSIVEFLRSRLASAS